MLKRSTWIWLAIALGLGFGIVAYDQVSQQREEQQAQQDLVLGLEEEEIQSFVIKTVTKTVTNAGAREGTQALTFTRPNEVAAPTQWEVSVDDQDPVQASDGAIAFLTNLILTGQSDGQLEATPQQLKEYVVDKPRARLIITLEDGETRELQLGKAGFDDQFVYARISSGPEADENNTGKNPQNQQDSGDRPAPAGESIQTIPKDFEYALIRDIKEWKYTPPSPEPTASQSVPLEAIPDPTSTP